MNTRCMTYKQLAKSLSLAEATMKKEWRGYPHFFVTAQSRKQNRLEGARFDLDDVLRELKKKEAKENGGNKVQRQVEGKLQDSRRTTAHQSGSDKTRRGGLAGRRAAKVGASDSSKHGFDVFSCLQ